MNRIRAHRAVRLLAVGLLVVAQAPVEAQSVKELKQPPRCGCLAETKVISFYDNATIPAGIGISSGTYTNVDGYRFINIFVEFEQNTAAEAPVSLGVIFAFGRQEPLGIRRYFNFEQNFTGSADPQMITLSQVLARLAAQHQHLHRAAARDGSLRPGLSVQSGGQGPEVLDPRLPQHVVERVKRGPVRGSGGPSPLAARRVAEAAT